MKKNKKINPTDNLIKEVLKTGQIKDLSSAEDFFKQIKKSLVEVVLNSELDDELGYPKHDSQPKSTPNRRNGRYSKTILDQEGEALTIDVPRDRDGEYTPQFIPKGVRRFPGFDDKVISLYARGMTKKEIQGHLEELYQTDVSTDLISTVTDGVIEQVVEWQNRPLDKTYPVVFLDCIHVKAREANTVINKAVYLAIAINMEGKK